MDPKTLLSQWIQQNPAVSRVVQAGQKGMPNIKNIIAIVSGKGGVGKSTTTVNLGLALAQVGARVGLLDADISGPNQPIMLGVADKPAIREGRFVPPVKYGVSSMSMGYLVDADKPVVWRGPMVSRAVEQLLYESHWGDLDYLLIDMPPGTGDIALTLAKKVPLAGVLVITTPQLVSRQDAQKALKMFQDSQIGVAILGIIENMAAYLCSHCGTAEAIFGQSGGQWLSDACQVPLLGGIPLHPSICAGADQGEPTVVQDSQGALAGYYFKIALAMLEQLALRPVNYAVKFPKVVVENH